VATVVGVFVLEESIDPLTYAGFGLVVVGFGLLKRSALAAAIEDASVAVHRLFD
jgi:drug/metabolite transporter (DMT)-like permease